MSQNGKDNVRDLIARQLKRSRPSLREVRVSVDGEGRIRVQVCALGYFAPAIFHAADVYLLCKDERVAWEALGTLTLDFEGSSRSGVWYDYQFTPSEEMPDDVLRFNPQTGISNVCSVIIHVLLLDSKPKAIRLKNRLSGSTKERHVSKKSPSLPPYLTPLS